MLQLEQAPNLDIPPERQIAAAPTDAPSMGRRTREALTAIPRRYPFLFLFLLLLLSNAGGSAFSFVYNGFVIVRRHLDLEQQRVFWVIAGPLYNLLAYPICVALMLYLIRPLWSCRRAMLEEKPIDPGRLEACRRRLLNLPALQLMVNLLAWIPGAFFFPLVICWLGGSQNAGAIWWQFGLSFTISAIFTTAQTFFVMEGHLMTNLYPEFFRTARPADVQGVLRIPFMTRLLALWLAVAVMPMLAVIIVAVNFDPTKMGHVEMAAATLIVAFMGIAVGGLIFYQAGRDLQSWVDRHSAATARIASGDFDVRVTEKRPDEWGRLTDRFNDMAEALERGRVVRETFGQFVGPKVSEEIIENKPGFEVDMQEITVLFADIRGFTRRCVGEAPERIGLLLNRFLSLALGAIEEKGGYVNKFLGDGVMALFGAALLPRDDHADLAIETAKGLLRRLDGLNAELAAEGQAPLRVGIGIHTGPALVGCFGATIVDQMGREQKRREYTAIGETVNFTQRIEQLTKECSVPILISEATRQRLRYEIPLEDLGPRQVPGSQEPIVVHRVVLDGCDAMGKANS